MNNLELKQKINQKLDQLNPEELTLVDNLLNQITSYLKNLCVLCAFVVKNHTSI
jgi:hypothetical protein